ncbi:hypothetical protein NECID01_1560 [Nematocida sp. AWRm77]|nr:hypothetical protein NECID01_1560 [Nematocida sp. AWRm77]
MEKKDQASIPIEDIVKELLEIAAKAEKCAREQTQAEEMENFLIGCRERVKELGQLVAVYSGIPQDSREALRLGTLVVVNFLNRHAGNLQFLTHVISGTITRDELRCAIIGFLHTVDAYMERDRQNMLVQIKRELAVLHALKESKKAAGDDPEWKSSIEDLEKKMRTMSISLRRSSRSTRLQIASFSSAAVQETSVLASPSSPSKSSKTLKTSKSSHCPSKEGKASRKRFLKMEQRKYKQARDLISALGTLTCFCNFQGRAVPSAFAVVRELILGVLDTNVFSYLYTLPRLCQLSSKISIDMCVPKYCEQNTQTYQKYIIRMLQNIADITKKETSLLAELLAVFYKEREIPRGLFQNLLLAYSPRRVGAISMAVNSRSSASFYINSIRLLYLVIHDIVVSHLTIEAANMDTSLLSLLSQINKIYHEKMLAKYLKKTKKRYKKHPVPDTETHTPSQPSRPRRTSSVTLADLSKDALRRKKKLVVRLMFESIFSSKGLLSEYFSKHHRLRTSIFQSVARVIAKRLSVSEINAQQESSLPPHGTPSREALLCRTVHKKLIRFLRKKAVVFISSRMEITNFVQDIEVHELENFGLAEQFQEIRMLMLGVFPLFVFSVASLP